ncbi:AAA family ATPase [Crocinitomicaceae bacterium CZZ-1]|uniref:AAA family ATPase n=1 Tax=Taishania pollutisoli TaxID=2766479 RepID=A0A8J6TZP8_9FLAO|nr:AAA family ATPase [Taishania pollutisoli]MBC9812383.1 AAA family ATPase [Taishania pollutisoli]
MIEKITIRNIATYDTKGVEIKDLKKINFIYGANGCGKTTITKLIDDPEHADFKDSSLSWKNGLSIKALVYNKDFRERNFGKGKIDGVFTLGQATKEEKEAIEKMKEQLDELKKNGIAKKEAKEKQEQVNNQYVDSFKEQIWSEVYKKYETDFKDAFSGYMRKDAFKAKLIEEYKTNTTITISYLDLKGKAQTIFGQTPILIDLIQLPVLDRIIQIENDSIWKKKILGKTDVDIASLIQSLNMNDWVNEGQTYLQSNKNTCPFCQQETISDDFRKQLEKYFDKAFIEDTNTVKALFDEYSNLSEFALNLLTQIETSQKAISNSKLNIDLFSASTKTLISLMSENVAHFQSKIKEPSRVIIITSIEQQTEILSTLVLNTNKQIDSHNKIVNDLSNQRSNLIKEIWKFLVEDHKASIEAFLKKSNGLTEGIKKLNEQQEEFRKKYIELNKAISEANKNVTSVQPSVDEINRILKSYGFLNFEIVPLETDPNQYQIRRDDGTIAESTLSEGEMTFITFLYFLQLSKGSFDESSITEDRILIIDDPISSLDSTVLYVVSSLLKEVIKNIKKREGNIHQLILLTHNVYFHKEVSFVDGRTPINGDTFFWILRRNRNITSVQSFEMENPIKNSYELLWKELRNREQNDSITVQNTMRRIIEHYYKILGEYTDDALVSRFDTVEEQEICRSLISWINDGSHVIPDDLYIEHQDTVAEKYFEVFKAVFDKTGHIEHYNMMMQVETTISTVV